MFKELELAELNKNIKILDTDLKTDELIKLTQICLEKVIVENERGVFEQSHGAPMGGGLSGILSNIYMEYLETIIFKDYPKLKWKCYRDNTFTVWSTAKHGPVTDFLKYLNTIDPYLKFTHKIEANNKLPFLDVQIHRKPDKLTTSVYRKETHSDRYIHYNSNHEPRIFLNTISSMVRRAIIYCTEPNTFMQEINHLQQTFTENGYPTTIVDYHMSEKAISILKKKISNNTSQEAENSKTVENKEETESSIWLRVPYDPYIWPQMQRLCNKFNVKIAGAKAPNIGQRMVRTRPKDSINQAEGAVYKIKCASCDTFYIGETCQKVAKRVQQHKTACSTILCTRKLKKDSHNDYGTAKHTLETGHHWDYKNADILATVANEKDRILRESTEILCHRQKA